MIFQPKRAEYDKVLDTASKTPYYNRNRYIRSGYIKRGPGMSDSTLRPEEMLPLTPAVFHILLALADGEKHGYSIMQEVARITNGTVQMGPGTLYGTIKRMLEAHLIAEFQLTPRSRNGR